MRALYLQSISQELVTHQSVIDNVEEKGKTLQSPTVATKLETLREQYKHLCKVVQVGRILIIIHRPLLRISIEKIRTQNSELDY